MKPIEFNILGVGAWGVGFRNAVDLQALLAGEVLENDGAKGPKPEIIPGNERRRAPLSVKLAVESSWQACQHAGLDAANLSSVFVSGLGDTQLTDYMCKVLAGENKALSPTKFHNSVHNAAAGYWTISTGCMQAANSVAGFEHSVSLTLLESLIQAEVEQRPILMTFYDAPASAILQPLLKNQHAFAASIIIAPASLGDLGPTLNESVLTAKVEGSGLQWPSRDYPSMLAECYQTNPAARVLPLFELIMAAYSSSSNAVLNLPLSEQTSLSISSV